MFSLRFQETLHFWRHHLWPLFAVTAPFALLSLNIQWYVGAPYSLLEPGNIQLNPLALMLILLLWPLTSATLVAQLAAIHSGKPQPLALCLLVALRSGALLLVGLLLMAAATTAGLLLLILPGLWILARLSMLPFVLVLENKSPIAALKDSFRLSQTQQWPLLFGYCFVSLLAFSLGNLVITALASLTLLPGWAAPLLGTLAYGLLGTLTDIYVFRFYLLATHDDAQQA